MAFGVLSALLFTARAPGASAGGPALDFSVGVDTLGGSMMTADTCSSSGTPTNVCNVRAGSTFMARFYLNSLPVLDNGDYEAAQMALNYDGVSPTPPVDFIWPDCTGPASNLSQHPGTVYVACVVLVDTSTYVGPMWEVPFVCDSSGSLTLVHGTGTLDTWLYDTDRIAEGEGTTESLTINCLSPQAYPVDTDGDGCPDMKEEGLMVSLGGMRDFLNPWDYFNPTHDGKNRVDDILQTVYQFFIDQGNPYYTQDTDRTLIGPMLWNLGPPDGTQRSQDILLSNKQFFHDCS